MPKRANSGHGHQVSPSLIAHRQVPYVRGMARQPKNFAIESVRVSPYEPAARVRIGPTAYVPRRFFATIVLTEPRAEVEMVVRVSAFGQASATEIKIETAPHESITTSTLRRILIDPMLRAAVAKATLPAEPVGDSPTTFRTVEGDLWSSPPVGTDERVVAAARIYTEAKAARNRAPTEAVAAALGYSRAQAARYVKRARETGLLPKLQDKPSKSGAWTKIRDEQS